MATTCWGLSAAPTAAGASTAAARRAVPSAYLAIRMISAPDRAVRIGRGPPRAGRRRWAAPSTGVTCGMAGRLTAGAAPGALNRVAVQQITAERLAVESRR